MPQTILTEVIDSELDGTSAVFTCATERQFKTESSTREAIVEELDRTVQVKIEFLSDTVFRLDLLPQPEITKRESVLDGELDADPSVVQTETADQYSFTTDKIELTIKKDPWKISVSDTTGSTLFAEQRNDSSSKGVQRAFPLSFSEEQVSNWPYRISGCNIAFTLGSNERFYGTGERFTDLDKRNQLISSWVTQPHGSETDEAYKNVPFYLSSEGYGLFVDTSERVNFDFGKESTISGQISTDDTQLSLVFFGGSSYKEILSDYTALSGRPSLPPRWSLGLWASRYSFPDQEATLEVAKELRKREIPCDGIHLDISWMQDGHVSDLEWNLDNFPDPDALIKELDELGYRLMVVEEPYLPVGTEAFETAVDNEYLINDSGGDPYILDRLSVSRHRAGIVDFTNAEACDWWQQKHQSLVEQGIDGFWTDFGEYLPEDAILSNGKSGRAMRNMYPHLYQKTVFESIKHSDRDIKPFLWARSGYSGSQSFPAHWGGDCSCTFDSMISSLKGGLSLMLSGYSFWSHDIGGFSGTPTPELYIRWAQFGLLSSHARYHGKSVREPWEFGEESEQIFRKFARLRYRLLPYLYTYSEVATETGIPLMRPLLLEYEDDPQVYDIDSSYMLGPDLLVVPVMSEGGSVEFYLPEGDWKEWWTDEWYEGGQWYERECELDEIPLFVSGGSVLTLDDRNRTRVGEPAAPSIMIIFDSNGSATGKYFDARTEKSYMISCRQEDGKIILDYSTDLEPVNIEIFGVSGSPNSIWINDEEHSISAADSQFAASIDVQYR